MGDEQDLRGILRSPSKGASRTKNVQIVSQDNITHPVERSDLRTDPLSPNDPYSYSNPQHMRVVAMHVDWLVNVQVPCILGHVMLDIEQMSSDVKRVILDVANLDIFTIRDTHTRTPLRYEMREQSNLGYKLVIDLEESLDESHKCSIKIVYQKNNTNGINFYEAVGGRKYPLMYSEFDYLRARSFFPCQDTPSNKIKFSAVVHMNATMDMLMSAKHVKTEQQSETTNNWYFANPHPIPVFAIGFVIGKFHMHELSDTVKIYYDQSVPNKYMNQLKKIPAYIELFCQTVGKDAWGEHHIVLASEDIQTCAYPYVYIFPNTYHENPHPHPFLNVILHSLSHNWFRNVVTARNMNHYWLNEGFSTYIIRKLLVQLGEEQELGTLISHVRRISQKQSIPLRHELDMTFSKEPLLLISKKAHLCLLVLEHYGGRYGEFDTLIKTYYEHNKFHCVDTDTFSRYAQKYLVFRNRCHEPLSPAVQQVANVKNWIDNHAPIPEEFYDKYTPFYRDMIQWLLIENENKIHQENQKRGRKRKSEVVQKEPSNDSEDEHEDICDDDNFYYFCGDDDDNDDPEQSSSEDDESNESEDCESNENQVTSPLLYLTPSYVNHRERKLVLLRKLQRPEELVSARVEGIEFDHKNDQPYRLKNKILNLLEGKLSLNCDKDKDMKFEFIKLSIAHQWCAQLQQIRQFVSRSVDMKRLIDIMQTMLLWQTQSDANSKLVDYKYTPMRQHIIELCDARLEWLISSQEDKLKQL
ncbi:hypothetical protein M8J75_000702 [Diaphorina citri]|nr:hypothetical protein M8J75_000702 [Diaphorina citri]